MPLSYRKLSGVCYEVRSGDNHYKYGDEYTSSLNIIIDDNGVAEISCLTGNISLREKKELNNILHELGVKKAYFMKRITWKF